MMAHLDPLADVFTPPGRCRVPSGEPVRGVCAYSAVIHPLHVRPVKTWMRAMEYEQPSWFQDPCGLPQYGTEVINIGGCPHGRYGQECGICERQYGCITLDEPTGSV